jgi:hypothetical protein
VKFINWYIGKLHMAARYHGALAIAFLEVANLKARPERLLHPAVIVRVIWAISCAAGAARRVWCRRARGA